MNAVDDHRACRRLVSATTRYVAVSASLQWGPGARPGFFRELDGIAPVRMTRRHDDRDLPRGAT